MYPLNMQLPEPQVGYALASNEEEHIALTAQGFLPAFVPADKPKKQAAAKE